MTPEMYRRVERHPGSGLSERDATELHHLFPDIELTSPGAWIERQDWRQLADST